MRRRGPGRNARRREDVFASRARFLALLLPVLFLLPASKAFYHQVVNPAPLRQDAFSQSNATQKVPARRGDIYDREGRQLATTLSLPSVFAVCGSGVDRAALARKLAPILEEDPAVLARALGEGKRFTWLKRWVTEDQARQARAVDPRLVNFEDDAKRFYPSRSMAAAVLGFVGKDGGLEGLERGLEDHLAGKDGLRRYRRDRKGRLYAQGEEWVRQPVPGSSVTLTLDSSIQFFAEAALEGACERTGARGGAAVVLETATGRVLAMASFPSFDPNAFSRFTREEFRNRAIQFLYEPGSTMKVVTVGAALEEKAIDERAAVYCEKGRLKVADRVIRDDEPHGWLTLEGVVAKSSNIGASKVGRALGRERLEAHLRDFGIGSRSDLLLPGEEAGTLRPAREWTVVDTASVSFGQSFAVTPLQVAAGFNALANGGVFVRPTLVERITSPDGQVVFQQASPPVRRVLSPEVNGKVGRYMEAVARTGGSGTLAAIPGYRVAGKTGTAQKFDNAAGAYRKGAYVASFAGFAPAGAPVVTAIVVLDEPRGESNHGGQVAAPAWREMVGKTLQYLGVLPDPALLPREETAAEEPRPAGSARPALRLASATAGVPPGPVMPDLLGQTLREAIRTLTALGCEAQVEGTGVVVEQMPAPGEPLSPAVLLTLEPKVRI